MSETSWTSTWYAPEQRRLPADELAHTLGNRVMALQEELLQARDENTLLRQENRRLREMTDTLTSEVVQLTARLLVERKR